MKKKLVLFDIDGTLVTKENYLPPSAKEAVLKLKEKGHLVGIATGRASVLIYDLLENLGIDTYVSFNGQCAVLNNNIVYKKPIPQNSLHRLSEAANEKGHPLVYMSQHELRTSMDNHEYVKNCYIPKHFTSLPLCDPLYFEKHEIFQTQLFIEEGKEQEYIDSFDELKFLRWSPVSLDVIVKGGSKGDGIRALIKTLDIGIEDVYVFGDSINDLEMFQLAGNSIAMGNSPDFLKEIASFVTKDVLNDGISYAVNQLGLLD